jgi:hypothetical protein
LPWAAASSIFVVARLDRAIQYYKASGINLAAAGYWIIRFRG